MYSKEVFVVTASYDKALEYDLSDSYRDSYILGVYSTFDLADRAAKKFIGLSSDDDNYCARATRICGHMLDSDWYEEFWDNE